MHQWWAPSHRTSIRPSHGATTTITTTTTTAAITTATTTTMAPQQQHEQQQLQQQRQQQPTEKLANNLFSKNESKERNVKKSFVAKIEKRFQSLLLFHWFFVFSIFYSNLNLLRRKNNLLVIFCRCRCRLFPGLAEWLKFSFQMSTFRGKPEWKLFFGLLNIAHVGGFAFSSSNSQRCLFSVCST